MAGAWRTHTGTIVRSACEKRRQRSRRVNPGNTATYTKNNFNNGRCVTNQTQTDREIMTDQLQHDQQQRLGQTSLTGDILNAELSFRKADGYAASLKGTLQRRNRVIVRTGTDGLSQYAAQEWVDEETGDRRYSCNCPAWTIWKNKAQDRWCSHCKELAQDSSIGDTPANTKPSTTKTTNRPPVTQVAQRRHRHIG